MVIEITKFSSLVYIISKQLAGYVYAHAPSLTTAERVKNFDQVALHTLITDVTTWMGCCLPKTSHCGELKLANVWSLFPTC